MRRCCLLAGRLPPPPLKIDALPGRLPPPPFADDGAALFMTKPVSRMECLNLSSESTAGFVGGFGAPPRGCVNAAMASGVASRTTICRALTARCCECFMAHGTTAAPSLPRNGLLDRKAEWHASNQFSSNLESLDRVGSDPLAIPLDRTAAQSSPFPPFPCSRRVFSNLKIATGTNGGKQCGYID